MTMAVFVIVACALAAAFAVRSVLARRARGRRRRRFFSVDLARSKSSEPSDRRR